MKNIKEEIIDGYKIKYKKHIFSKNIKITLSKDLTVLVTMPIFCSYKIARDFLYKNFEKIKNFKINKKTYTPDLKTKFDTLKIIKSDILKIQKKKEYIYFYYPKNEDFNSDKIQNKLKEAYKKALKTEAKNYLINRIDFLAKKYNFKYNKIALKNQKTRFGSCSIKNNINLNINLMLYDTEVIDYVLIHELVHTKIKNHSKNFWIEVEKYCPKYKILRKKLKETPVYNC